MEEFIHMVFRLLHPPSSQDLLVVKRNLAKLCDALGCDVFDAPPPLPKDKTKNKTASLNRGDSTVSGAGSGSEGEGKGGGGRKSLMKQGSLGGSSTSMEGENA